MELPLPVLSTIVVASLVAGYFGAKLSGMATDPEESEPPDPGPPELDPVPVPVPVPVAAPESTPLAAPKASEAVPASEAEAAPASEVAAAPASEAEAVAERAPEPAAPPAKATDDGNFDDDELLEGQNVMERALFADEDDDDPVSETVSMPDVHPTPGSGFRPPDVKAFSASDLPDLEPEPLDTESERLPLVEGEDDPTDPEAPLMIGELPALHPEEAASADEASAAPPRVAEGTAYPSFHEDDESTLIDFDNFEDASETGRILAGGMVEQQSSNRPTDDDDSKSD